MRPSCVAIGLLARGVFTSSLRTSIGTTKLPARDSTYEWQAASDTDSRSPCPMLNALANHGYLQHDGLNVSMADLTTALLDSVNLAPEATALVGAKALAVKSSTGRNDTFDLSDLDQHGILEHDGSLSRADTYFGDNHDFNSTIWLTTLTHFTNNTISISQAAAARSDRLAAAAVEDPEFSLSASAVQFSLIESALYLGVLGNTNDGNPKTEFVKVLFEEERIPFDEGFTKSETEISSAALLTLAAKVAAA